MHGGRSTAETLQTWSVLNLNHDSATYQLGETFHLLDHHIPNV